MSGAGWPSQPWSTRKAASRGGQAARGNGGNGEVATLPMVVAHTSMPRGRKRLKPTNGANGRRAGASAAVTATTMPRDRLGSDGPGFKRTQPGAGRNRSAGEVHEPVQAEPVAAPAGIVSASAHAPITGHCTVISCDT